MLAAMGDVAAAEQYDAQGRHAGESQTDRYQSWLVARARTQNRPDGNRGGPVEAAQGGRRDGSLAAGGSAGIHLISLPHVGQMSPVTPSPS